MTITEAEVLELEDKRWAAQINEDLESLGDLLCDELRYTHSNTIVDTKASYIEAIANKTFDYRRADRSDTEVQIIGGTALVTGRADIHVVAGERDLQLSARYSVVWVDRGDRWQLLMWQSTPVPS